jgi:hypothetical protein
MFKGLDLFKKKHPGLNFKLITFEYGNDIQESKKLINELDLNESIIWLPMMNRKEIMIAINLSDIGIGQFGIGWYSYGSIMEYMAMGVPVIHQRKINNPKNQDKYPMINAKDAQEVANGLSKLYLDKIFYKKISDDTLNWFNKNFIKNPIKKFTKEIANQSNNIVN